MWCEQVSPKLAFDPYLGPRLVLLGLRSQSISVHAASSCPQCLCPYSPPILASEEPGPGLPVPLACLCQASITPAEICVARFPVLRTVFPSLWNIQYMYLVCLNYLLICCQSPALNRARCSNLLVFLSMDPLPPLRAVSLWGSSRCLRPLGRATPDFQALTSSRPPSKCLCCLQETLLTPNHGTNLEKKKAYLFTL